VHDGRDQELNGSKSLVVTILIVSQRHGNIIEAHDQRTVCVLHNSAGRHIGLLYLATVIVAVTVEMRTCACQQPTRQLCCSAIGVK